MSSSWEGDSDFEDVIDDEEEEEEEEEEDVDNIFGTSPIKKLLQMEKEKEKEKGITEDSEIVVWISSVRWEISYPLYLWWTLFVFVAHYMNLI